LKTILVPGLTTGLKRTDESKSSISLGVLTISAILDQNNYNNEIVDLDIFIQKNNILLKDLHVKTAEMLLEKKAQLYGFFVAVGILHHVVNITHEIKKVQPNALFVLGGPHASAMHREILENFNEINFIIRGEGDNTIVELLQAIEGKIDLKVVKGITYINESNEIIVNDDRELIQDLDCLPLPAYKKYPFDKEVLDVIPIDVGRGCPYNCSFCSTSVFWRRTYRLKSADRIIKEMIYVKENFKAKKIFIMHDCLTVNKRMVKELSSKIKEANLSLPWGCAARLDHIDEEMLDILTSAGCSHLELGIESGSKNIRKSINKKIDIEDTLNQKILDKLKLIHEKNISLILFFICGFNDETKEDVQQTLSLIGKSLVIMEGNGWFRLTFLSLFPGSPIFNTQKEQAVFSLSMIEDEALVTYSDFLIETAKTTDLFPEFYYFKNENKLENDYFLELSSVFSSAIKILGTDFYLTFKTLMNIFYEDIEKIFNLWLIFEKSIKKKIREISVFLTYIIDFINFVIKTENLEGYEYLNCITEYELLCINCKLLYLKNWNKKRQTENPVKGFVLFKKFPYDISSLIKSEKIGNAMNIEQYQQKIVIMAFPVYSEVIQTAKVTEQIRDIVELCDGTHSINDISEIITEKYNIEDIDKFNTDLQSLLNQLKEKNIILKNN